MLKKFSDWLDICKTHWKEIFALSFVFHFLLDIVFFGLLIFIVDLFFGVHIEIGH